MSKQPSTIREWLESIPDEEVRKRALANEEYKFSQYDWDEDVTSMYARYDFGDALSEAFSWESTPEGYDYWLDKLYNLFTP